MRFYLILTIAERLLAPRATPNPSVSLVSKLLSPVNLTGRAIARLVSMRAALKSIHRHHIVGTRAQTLFVCSFY